MTHGSNLDDHLRRAADNAVRREVAATPERVFDVISNGWMYPVWVVGAARMRHVDAEWPTPGSRLHHSFGLWPLMLDDETQVITATPPERIVLKARGWPAGEAVVEITIRPTDDGCVVQLGEDASDGPGRLVPHALRRPVIQVRNRETLRRLAFIAEGQATGQPTATASRARGQRPRSSSPRT
jgi:uncharacterized protein YndB with AHSA1/START domain